ncbi:MAG: hypothetical protein LC793_16230 [Thermomicrobia bacterium]|nr:hypothetical protein [Thermomicrobia bacterium]
MTHQCVDGSTPSPAPWKIHRRALPFQGWIGDASGGLVCGLFGRSDESLLVAAPALLAACEAFVATFMDDDREAIFDAYQQAYTAVRAAKGEG